MPPKKSGRKKKAPKPAPTRTPEPEHPDTPEPAETPEQTADTAHASSEIEDKDGDQEGNTSPDPRDSSPAPESEDDAISTQASNARGKRWLPWQDRYLVKEVDETRPFLQPSSESTQAWDELARNLQKNSRKDGEQSEIQRTGNACRTRFKYIMKHHRVRGLLIFSLYISDDYLQEKNTKSLQKTGTNELVTAHIELLDTLMALMDDKKEEQLTKTSKDKGKVDLEAKAGMEFREAAMTGQVPREKLTSITQLDSATTREKQGQRNAKRQ